MTAIERTAYPELLQGRYRQTDLRFYQPTIDEINFMDSQNIRTDTHRLNFMLQLKTFQQLHYFMLLKKIPASVTHHVCQALDLPVVLKPHYHHSDTTARHRALIREYCQIKTDKVQRQSTIETVAFESAQTLNDPAEIINAVLDSLAAEQYEFPAFTTLNKIVCHIRTKVNAEIFKQITERLRNARKLTLLSETLTKDNTTGKSPYHFFKALPQKPTVTHFKELLQHHDSLMTYGEMRPYLKDISEIKLAQFAEEARALDAPHLKAMNDKNKRYALLACLLAEAQKMAKDAAGKSCTISIHSSEKEAKQKYTGNQQKRDQLMVDIVQFVLNVTTGYENKKFSKRKLLNI